HDRSLELHFRRAHEARLAAGGVQRARDGFDQQSADDQAAVTCDRGDEHGLLHDHRDDRGRGGAERLAQADLAGALLHDDQHDVADADRAREDGADRDDPAEPLDAGEQAVHLVVLFLQVEAAEHTLVVRADLVDLCEVVLDVALGHARVNAGLGYHDETADPSGLVEGVTQRVVWQIDAFLFLLLVAVLRGLEHADRFENDAVDLEVLAQRILIRGEQLIAHTLADHCYLAALLLVHVVERAPLDDLQGVDVLHAGEATLDAEGAIA